MTIEDEDLKEVLKELSPFFVSPFINFYCDKCDSSLEERGDEPLIFGESDDFSDNFPDLILCGKCAADFLNEEDYHSQEVKTNGENIRGVKLTEEINQVQIREIQKVTYDVLKSLASGMSEKEILSKFPYLTHKDILACYSFAAQQL